MDPVQFLKCILFLSLDRIIIYWNKLYDLRKLVGLPVWFVGPANYTALSSRQLQQNRWISGLFIVIKG